VKIRNKKDILKFSATTTLGVSILVACTALLAYPPEEWAWELQISLSLTFVIMMSVCYFVGLKSLEMYKLTLELQRLVERDRLTDVATRDHFYSRMAEDADSFGVSLMVDIDNFKLVNDTYGHIAGDEVIRAVATVLRENVRDDDVVCRFGGEEFVIFLREHDEDQALRVAERIRRTVASHSVDFEGLALTVTVSIGGSNRCRVENIDGAIRQADAALYRAKARGRNVTLFPVTGPTPLTA